MLDIHFFKCLYGKNQFHNRLFSLSIFPSAAILNNCDVLRLPLLFSRNSKKKKQAILKLIY